MAQGRKLLTLHWRFAVKAASQAAFMGYNSGMAQIRCNCGWCAEVPDLLARQPVVCKGCRAILNARPRVPYGYAPFDSWHPPVRTTVAPPPALPLRNTPALVALTCGSMALSMALFAVRETSHKGVISLALLAMATAIIGLHLSGQFAQRGRGKISAALGLMFAILALIATPLPGGPGKGKLKRVETPARAPYVCPKLPAAPEFRREVPKPPAPAQKAAPAAPVKPVDEEQEEGF